MALVVLDMNDRRPVWAMPAWVPERVRAAFPADWRLRVVDEETDGSGDGAGRVSAEVLDAVAEARVYLGYGVPEQLLEAGPRLEWVHSGAAGVGSSLTPAMLASPVIFTNSAGVHAPPMAETVLGMILHFGRGLDLALVNQRRGAWSSEAFYEAGAPLRELSRSTVGIVGFGGVGREVARRAVALGARVIALRRSRKKARDPVGDAEGAALEGQVEIVHGPKGLECLLRRSDYVVLAAPETRETRGLIDAEALACMRPEAVLVNVGRGGLVVESALVDALAGRRIRGAGLDVYAKEPLPEGHALWSLPNVILTPHVSAVTDGFWGREAELIVENTRRFVAGEELLNVVDKRAGY